MYGCRSRRAWKVKCGTKTEQSDTPRACPQTYCSLESVGIDASRSKCRTSVGEPYAMGLATIHMLQNERYARFPVTTSFHSSYNTARYCKPCS